MNPTTASPTPPTGRGAHRAGAGRAFVLALARAFALALILGGLLAARAPHQAPVPPAQDPAAAAKAAEAARLKADFDRYAAELRTAVAGFQAEIAGLQQRGVAREKWPPHPNVVHYPRFEELAYQDQPDALRWCLTALGQIGVDARTVAEKKAEIYARLVVVHADLPWMSDVARWIQSDGTDAGIGFVRADELLQILAESSQKATRAAALAARSALLSARTDPASRAEHARLVRELAEKHADTPAGAAAKGELFKAEFLVPGKTPPDVVAVDTDGKPLRLADYRGKVLVLEFWGFW